MKKEKELKKKDMCIFITAIKAQKPHKITV
jgi:hypothetical protein